MTKLTKENVLCINSLCKTDSELKDFLFSNDIKQNKCEICSQICSWNGKKLEMMVHRKVKKKNNLLDNLMILCPNCFSQKQTIRKKKEGRECLTCGKIFFSNTRKIVLDPSMELINPNKEKIMYQQTRCKFCLEQSMVDNELCNEKYKVI